LITRIQPGTRLSKAVVANNIVFISGLTAEVKAPDLARQTSDVLTQIDRLLLAAKSTRSSLLFVQVWLTDIRQFASMNEVWEGWIDAGSPPARATVEARLVGDALIEMMAIAYEERA
jgi:enamine deaminase RidA (YjgF/YER057c/UK114 family)